MPRSLSSRANASATSAGPDTTDNVGAFDRRERERPRQKGLERVSRKGDRHHGASGNGPHQLTARLDEAKRILERKHA